MENNSWLFFKINLYTSMYNEKSFAVSTDRRSKCFFTLPIQSQMLQLHFKQYMLNIVILS